MQVLKYEAVFIAEPEISTAQVDEVLAKIKTTLSQHQGSVLSEDRWGRRRLAYAIRGHREGFYTVVLFEAAPGGVSALDHLFNITGSVIRHLTVRQLPPPRERPAKESQSHRAPARSAAPSRPHPEPAKEVKP